MSERILLDAAGVWINTILADDGYEPPEGYSTLALGEGVGADIGWSWLNGSWTAPVAPPVQSGPRRVSRIDFTRLFTGVQQVKINALRKAVAALTVEDYEDPASSLTVQLELVFQAFDLPDEFIELDHPDLALALELLAYAGVFGVVGTDDAVIASETARIVAGEPPPA